METVTGIFLNSFDLVGEIKVRRGTSAELKNFQTFKICAVVQKNTSI